MNVSKDTIEAAYIDGCNWIQAYFFVKLPAIKNMFFVVLVILVNGCLKGFDVSYILTGGGPGLSLIHISVILERFFENMHIVHL